MNTTAKNLVLSCNVLHSTIMCAENQRHSLSTTITPEARLTCVEHAFICIIH